MPRADGLAAPAPLRTLLGDYPTTRDADVPIETGPHKHSIGQTFFLYCYEPGGNRFEIGAGGYLILDPGWKPVVWTQAERAKGQAWGLQTVSTFHTHGTPPAPVPDR